jgi:hypothetical protein
VVFAVVLARRTTTAAASLSIESLVFARVLVPGVKIHALPRGSLLNPCILVAVTLTNWVILETRITVELIQRKLSEDASAADLLDWYPSPRREGFQAAICRTT